VWEPWLARVLLLAALVVGAAIRIWLSLNDDGIYWPDEIYQSLEPAHRLAFGYGLVAWEFVKGARSWFLPGVLAGVLKISALFGADSPRQYLYPTRILFSALSILAAWGSYRLARIYRTAFLPAALAGTLGALAAPAIYFAPRAMSENASAPAVVWGLALTLDAKSRRWERAIGASLLAVAVLLRLQNAVFCLGALAILASRRDWNMVGEASAVLGAWAFLGGLLDKLTWGGWFHSSLAYLTFNVVQGGAAQWGVAEFSYYARVLWSSMPLVSLLLLLLLPLSAIRAQGTWLTVAAFFLLHSCIPHKEMRFLLPALPVLFSLGGIGASVVTEQLSPFGASLVCAAIAAVAGLSAARFHRLKFGDLGQYESLRPNASAYDDFGDLNRLLIAAHRLPDLCGLKVEAVHLAWTGGYTYLHRNVPLYPHTGPPRTSMFYNYVLSVQGNGGWPVTEVAGPFVLLRMPWAKCSPDPGYSSRLP